MTINSIPPGRIHSEQIDKRILPTPELARKLVERGLNLVAAFERVAVVSDEEWLRPIPGQPPSLISRPVARRAISSSISGSSLKSSMIAPRPR